MLQLSKQILFINTIMNNTTLPQQNKRDKQIITSYYQQYQQKGKNVRSGGSKSTDGFFKKWNEIEINHRRDKIMRLVQQNQDASLIRIQDSIANSLNSRITQPEDETNWIKKISQIKKKLKETQFKVEQEEKEIKELENHLENKKFKHAHLLDKKQNLSKTPQQNAVTDEQPQKYHFQQQLDQRARQCEEQLNNLKEDKKTIFHQISGLQAQLASLKRQFKKIESAQQTEETVEDLNQLLSEGERIKQNIGNLQLENHHLEAKIEEMEHATTPTQQLYRRFIQLYEQIFLQRQLQKVDQLMQAKQRQLKKQQQYQKNKILLKQKRKQTQHRQKKINQKNKQIEKLTQQIMQKSNALLNLYDYDNTKHK